MQSRTGPIAYTVQRFPDLTITFIYREVMALRAQGIEVAVFSTWQPRRDQLSQEAVGLVDSTFYIFPLKVLPFIAAHLACLLTRPLRYLGTLLFIIRRSGGGSRNRARGVIHFAEAVYLARQMEKRKVRHIHGSFASNPANLALIVSRLTGISFSFAAHANDIFADQILLREKLAAARFVIASTQYNKDYLRAQFPGIAEDKIQVIHHGVSLRDFRPGERESRDSLPMILAVAQFREKKGLPFLVEACHLLKEGGHKFACSIVGDGPQRSMLESLISRYDLQDTVRLEGIVFQESLKDYYRRADILVLPSVVARDRDRDGIPVTLIEAMAMGCPVVSTTVSGIPELVEHGRTGLLVPPGDARMLAEALLTLLQDERLRLEMGRASRAKVVTEFDLKESVDQVSALFAHELRA